MSFIVTLEDFVPPPRADATPFTHARIEEAAAEAGPFTTIATLALPSLDTDAEQPAPRELTFSASLAEGWYRVVWTDAVGHETTPTAPIQNAPGLPRGLRPSRAEVASLVRARTKIKGGVELGTFTTVTRPTGAEVDDLIDEAEVEVLGKVVAPENYEASGTPRATYERRIRGTIRLYAALLIELSYFPEQVGTDKSPASVYERLYAMRIESVIGEGEAGHPGGMGGKEEDSPADAAYSFPSNTGGLIGWGTSW